MVSAIALALWLAPPLPLGIAPSGSRPLGSQRPSSRAIGSVPLRGAPPSSPPIGSLPLNTPAAGSLSLRNLPVGVWPPMGQVVGALPIAEPVVASRARRAPVLPTLKAPGPGPAEPPTAPALTAQQSGGSPDRSRRFPLRRESGGTRGACAARLLAHLVPEDGVLDTGPQPLLGLIEGDGPEPVPLVLRWPGGESIQPARRGASLRLLLLPAAPGAGLWESFPACEGSAEPQAPPARSLLASGPGDAARRTAREALRTLWNQCGQSVNTAELLDRWGYSHLADRLPTTLTVLCATPIPRAG
ncbi:MAG: hypothetical protein ACK5N0_11795 [Synechococcaceae cyanobacterium]